VRIALKPSGASGTRARNQADRFPDLVRYRSLAEAIGSAPRFARVDVKPHERNRQAMPEKARDSADRARLRFAVIEREVPFGGRVVLEDPRNSKSPLELLPDLGLEAVAAGKPQPVLGLARIMRTANEVAAQL